MDAATSGRISGVMPPSTLQFTILCSNTWFDFGYSSSATGWGCSGDGNGAVEAIWDRRLCPFDDGGVDNSFTVISIFNISIALGAEHKCSCDSSKDKD